MNIKCTKEFNPGKGATIDKEYKLVNRKIIYDNGQESFRDYDNIDQVNNFNTAKFNEVKRRGRPKKIQGAN